jgi:putative ATPase
LFEDDSEQTPLPLNQFETPATSSADAVPLAARLRPRDISEYVGQVHLIGPDAPLANLIAQRRVHSMILWGPPGTGKTTLAYLLAENAEAKFIAISAVLAGIKDVREAVEHAKLNRSQGVATVLFVDEVHRFNKAQQDAFLPHVESGLLTFIGATTENPSFEVNQALLSRARVYVLKPLSDADLERLAQRAAQFLKVRLTEGARTMLGAIADGDARRMLNVLDVATQFGAADIDVEQIESAVGESVRRFDKGGDVFYEQISALHKSLRGSAPDAALYWFCRMLDGGADPRYIGRRLIRFASEDIGNADPRALELCNAAMQSFERLGSPEGELALAQAVLYMASVPKSNAAYKAFGRAMDYVRENPSYPVPMHIRNAPTGLMKNLGYGQDYRYAHDEPDEEGGYAAGEDYFPEEMAPQQFYQPKSAGLESKIAQRLARLRSLDDQATQRRRR